MHYNFYKHVAPTVSFFRPFVGFSRGFVRRISLLALLGLAVTAWPAYSQQLSRDEWGGMPVTVSQQNGTWIIAGKKRKVILNERNLGMTIEAGSVRWSTVASSSHDMIVKTGGGEFALGLGEAKQIQIVSYDAGFKTGIKISLNGWSHNAKKLDLNLFLSICLEGRDEDLVFDIAASEHDTTLRQLDWPGTLDAREVDYTLLSNGRGTLLPRNWAKEYYPIRSI